MKPTSVLLPSFALAQAAFSSSQNIEAGTRDIALAGNSDVALVDKRQQVIVDCNKMLEQVVGYMQQYPTYSTKVRAIAENAGLGGVFAYSACKTFKPVSVDCYYAGLAVGSGIALAVNNGFVNGETEGSTPVTQQKRRRQLEDAAGRLEAAMIAAGHSIGSVHLEHDLTTRGEAGEAGAASSYRIHLLDVADPDRLTLNDFAITSHNDGTGVVNVRPSASSGLVGGGHSNSTSAAHHHHRREDASGLNISYQGINIVSSPTANALNSFSSFGGTDWANQADADQAMTEYIGLVDFDVNGSMQYRISPEVSGFTPAYEDVNSCAA